MGLLFVAISVHAATIAASADLRNRVALLAVPLVVLDRRARDSGPRRRLSRTLKVISPNTVTAVGTATAGTLILCGIRWGNFLLVPSACFDIIGALASAWLFLTKLEDRHQPNSHATEHIRSPTAERGARWPPTSASSTALGRLRRFESDRCSATPTAMGHYSAFGHREVGLLCH